MTTHFPPFLHYICSTIIRVTLSSYIVSHFTAYWTLLYHLYINQRYRNIIHQCVIYIIVWISVLSQKVSITTSLIYVICLRFHWIFKWYSSQLTSWLTDNLNLIVIPRINWLLSKSVDSLVIPWNHYYVQFTATYIW